MGEIGDTMPKKKFASWEGKPNFRWVKMINGERHRITCKKLGLPDCDWTKEKSWEKAAAHFARIEAELAVAVLEPGAQSAIDLLERKLQFAKINRHVESDELESAIEKIERDHHSIDGFDTDPTLEKTLGTFRLLGGVVPDGLDSEQLSQIFGSGKLWRDRLRNQKQVESVFTLTEQVSKWLELEKNRGIEHKTYLEYKTRSKDIISTLGEQFDCREINTETVTQMYRFYLGAKIQKKRNGFRIFKRFVRILVENDICGLPKNIDSKLFEFPTIQPKAIKAYDDALVIKTLKELPERARLYALLALNCTMTNKDIANLSKHPTNGEYASMAWVDLKKGTITRSRIKTKKKNPPVVTYKLWKSTIKLLKKFWSIHERWVLTSKANTKLVGDGNTTDLVSNQWDNTDSPIMLVSFRTISGTACGSEPLFAPYRTLWLANKPSSVTDAHYDATTQATIDKISDYIGNKFKQV